MKDMLAQCESNTNELQQLQVPVPSDVQKSPGHCKSGCSELELAFSSLTFRSFYGTV